MSSVCSVLQFQSPFGSNCPFLCFADSLHQPLDFLVQLGISWVPHFLFISFKFLLLLFNILVVRRVPFIDVWIFSFLFINFLCSPCSFQNFRNTFGSTHHTHGFLRSVVHCLGFVIPFIKLFQDVFVCSQQFLSCLSFVPHFLLPLGSVQKFLSFVGSLDQFPACVASIHESFSSVFSLFSSMCNFLYICSSLSAFFLFFSNLLSFVGSLFHFFSFPGFLQVTGSV